MLKGFAFAACGGGGGGYDSKYISVIPNKTYSLSIGSGGAGAGHSEAGKSGFVLIAFGGDI